MFRFKREFETDAEYQAWRDAEEKRHDEARAKALRFEPATQIIRPDGTKYVVLEVTHYSNGDRIFIGNAYDLDTEEGKGPDLDGFFVSFPLEEEYPPKTEYDVLRVTEGGNAR